MPELAMDREPHRETKAVFRGKARRRDGQPGGPALDRESKAPKSEAALGMRTDWYKETESNGPDATGATEVSYAGLLISTRVLKGVMYKLTFHARSFTADTVGFGFAIQVRDEGGAAIGAALGPKMVIANVGAFGGTFTWMYIPDATAYKTFQLKYSRVSGSGTGNIQATADNKTWFALEVTGNDELPE
jgi:hypothetical protein